MKQLILKDWRKICSYILIIIGIISINKSFLFCMVEGISMQPTLNENNRILVNKASIYFSSFHHGDIVIIKKEDEPTYYVKRIIGLPGDNVQVRNGDNRNHSMDSRNTLGLIDESHVIGKVKMVYYPFDQIKWLK
ncbi:signal peptidase I [Bacillus toyonensis]|uniref:signal peptidase I n=1 Tax=Bacillus toyonensis TaxID=155322 RepID=UPI000BFD9114|nr:signal peptidase I [Bacillus toyonensis]PHD55713.1 signal peptidase I [Bacillus toyonensis]